jgi:cold shock protein
MQGRVKFWNVDKAFGFVAADDGDGDVFVHITAVLGGYHSLAPDQAVRFEIVSRPDGRFAASNVSVCEPIISQRRTDDEAIAGLRFLQR